MRDIDELTQRIIGCAIEVHRALGPGLLEACYEEALCIEFDEQRIRYRRQLPVQALYKGRPVGAYRVDILVEDAVVVEVKSVASIVPVFEAKILNHLRITGKKVGLIINFNERLLKDGIRRFVL